MRGAEGAEERSAESAVGREWSLASTKAVLRHLTVSMVGLILTVQVFLGRP